MFALGKKVGKQTAHHILYEISQAAFEQGQPLVELLLKHPIVSKELTGSQIEQAIDPARHLGLSTTLTERVIKLVQEKLAASDFEKAQPRVCPLMDERGGCSVPKIV